MSKVLTISRLALFFMVMALASNAVAAEKATPSGKLTIESRSIAAGIGITWGDGKLNFNGKDYPFSIDGLTLVDFGISKASAAGEVYNLTDPRSWREPTRRPKQGLPWPAAWAVWCCAIRMG